MWPSEFAWRGPVPEPALWGRPGVVLFFNLECPGCISRGIPFLRGLAQEHGDALELVMIHTSYGHKHYGRDEVLPTLKRFAESFARLPFPVGLDLEGDIARHHGVEGTPHWLVFDRHGRLARSIFGSQENARLRLRYLLDELVQAA